MNARDVSRAEFDALQESQRETHEMVREMHNALMKPQPGYGDKSLISRMAEVTIRVETGDRVIRFLIFVGKGLGAIGVIAGLVGAAWVALRFGAPPVQ